MPNALDVAKYFLSKADADEAGDVISNLKLQKLLYYAQGFHLALTGAPLFEEDIQAWVHGPVVREVWQAFNQYGANGIPAP
ncbi:MAG: putative prophage protein, partial [Verrucomicrobiaceae bacterium]|nr:putative prophage protein [Verrucomicrobiaceae bacterium]